MKPNRRWFAPLLRASLAILAVIVGRAPLAAQPSNTRAQLVTYVVDADRRIAFEQVIDAIAARLRAGTAGALSPITMQVFRVVQDQPSRTASYALLIQPPLAGTAPALEAIIAGAWPPDDAARWIEQLKRATGGGGPAQATIETIQTVTPLDSLRSRLEADLADVSPPPGRGGSEPGDDIARLKQLEQPLWAVDDVRYEIVNPAGRDGRVRWTIDVRNSSIVRPLSATVSVVLHDRRGAVVATGAPISIQLDPQMSQSLSGEISLSHEAALSVTNASATVDVKR